MTPAVGVRDQEVTIGDSAPSPTIAARREFGLSGTQLGQDPEPDPAVKPPRARTATSEVGPGVLAGCARRERMTREDQPQRGPVACLRSSQWMPPKSRAWSPEP